jgi:hypothetical protein
MGQRRTAIYAEVQNMPAVTPFSRDSEQAPRLPLQAKYAADTDTVRRRYEIYRAMFERFETPNIDKEIYSRQPLLFCIHEAEKSRRA